MALLNFDTIEIENLAIAQKKLGIVPGGPGSSSVPAGGTTDQVLAKASNADGDTTWVDQSGGGGGGAPTNAQYLVGALNGTLSAERLVTDTTTVAWDLTTAGTAKANVPSGSLTDVQVNAANKDGASATASLRTLGTGAAQACAGNDSRLTNSRTPTAHASTHAAAGSDPVTLSESQVTNLTTDLAAKEATANKNQPSGYAGLDGSSKLTGSQQVYGTTANTACQGNDSRLSDSRTPTAHATTHKSGGSDAIKLDELAAPTDITTLNVSTSAHGLTPKLPNDATKFLDGTGAYTVPTGSSSGITLGKAFAIDQGFFYY